MTPAFMDVVLGSLKTVRDSLRDHFDARCAQIEVDLAATNQRVAELTAALARSTNPYRGVWQTDTTYEKGSEVTFGGSVWHAREQTTARPGGDDGAAGWVLKCKRGRDGKDLR